MFFSKPKVYSKEEYQGLKQSTIEKLMRTDYRAKFEYARRNYKARMSKDNFIPFFEECAFNGIEEAYDYLGYIYYEGKYVEKNISKAIHYYIKGIELGDLTSYYDLSHLLYREKNLDKAKAIALQGFNKGCKDCAITLFQCFAATENKDEARKWLLIGAENNESLKNILGDSYRDGDYGLEVSLEKAFKCYLESIDNVDSKTQVGKMLVTGQGCVKDVERGMALLEEAANTNMTANVELGNIYLKGIGVNRNFKRAIDYYSKLKGKENFDSYAYHLIGYAFFWTSNYYFRNVTLGEEFLPREEVLPTCLRLLQTSLVYANITYEKEPSEDNKSLIQVIKDSIEIVEGNVKKFNSDTNHDSISTEEIEAMGNIIDDAMKSDDYGPDEKYKVFMGFIEEINSLLKSDNVTDPIKRVLCFLSADAHLGMFDLMYGYYNNKEEGRKFFAIAQYMADKVEIYAKDSD